MGGRGEEREGEEIHYLEVRYSSIMNVCVDEVCMCMCVCVGTARNTLLIASLTPQQWPLRVSSLHANVIDLLNGRLSRWWCR